MTIGALIGGPVAGFMSDKFGRKTAFILTGITSAIGWFCLSFSFFFNFGNFPAFFSMLLIGRFVSGFSAGWVSLVVPVSCLSLSLSSLAEHGLYDLIV